MSPATRIRCEAANEPPCKEPFLLSPMNRLKATLTALALFAPLACGVLYAPAKAQGPPRATPRRVIRKMTDDLLSRSSSARANGSETTRVILRAGEGRTGEAVASVLRGAGARGGERVGAV